MRDYGELLRVRLDLEQYRGFLTAAEQKEQMKVQGRYDALRKTIVYSLLSEQPDGETATATMRAELEAERPGTPDDWLPIVDLVEEDLAQRIARDAGARPWLRTVRHRAPWIVGAVVLAVYFGVRLYSLQTIDQPIETRAGLEQRAAATLKTIRHADWTDSNRRRWILEVILWPIAPTEAELKATGEFAALVDGGRRVMASAGAICGVPAPAAEITQGDIDLFARVAEVIRAPATRWATPPMMTVLPPIRTSYPCR